MQEPRATTPRPAPPRQHVAGSLKLPLEAETARPPKVAWPIPLAVTVGGLLLAWADPARRAPWLGIASVALGILSYLLFTAGRGDHVVKAWLVVDDDEISRVQSSTRAEGRGRTSLARWDAPFGLSILANAARSRVLFAFTTPAAIRFLRLRVDTARDADVARDLLDRAITVGDVELELATAGAREAQLGAAAARTFVEELDRRDPHARSRLYLSDARGTAIAVEPDRLTIGERTFDLASPVEWRIFTFQETEVVDRLAAALYQATAIRQGATEVVLVCRAGAEAAAWSTRRSDVPPAKEARVAIDGLFMTPLRAVLEHVPRVSRPGAPSSRLHRSV